MSSSAAVGESLPAGVSPPIRSDGRDRLRSSIEGDGDDGGEDDIAGNSSWEANVSGEVRARGRADKLSVDDGRAAGSRRVS